MKRIALLISALLVSVEGHMSGSSLPEENAGAGPGVGRAAAGQPLQASDLILAAGDAQGAANVMSHKLRSPFVSKDFSALDQMANELRASKAQTADGTWQLQIFYNALDALPRSMVDADWRKRIEFLQEWVRARPDSITARVALATAYKNYAWHARGGGYADTVRDEGWRLFEVRLHEAEDVLVKAKKLEAKCPFWWHTMQVVARGAEWDRAAYEKLFNEAVAYEPSLVPFYTEKVTFLLPRWYGREGEWQTFAQEAANKLGGEEGDILYARIGWAVHDRRFYEEFLKDSGFSWERMKRGLQALTKRYPASLSAPNELAYLACQTGERTLAQPLFVRMGLLMDADVWGEDKARFLRARTWALSGVPSVVASENLPPGLGQQNPQAQSAEPQEVQGLVLNGISGSPNRRLVMINNHTFETGESAKIRVGQQTVSVKCLEIKERSAVILLEGSGQPKELRLR